MQTVELKKQAWSLARRTLSFGERTLVMGILNVTPDSFSDGNRFFTVDQALARAEEMIAEGVDIIDVGGESTRPAGAALIPVEEELRRVLPVIERLAKTVSVPISIDTTKAEIARRALDAGAEIINDISALRFDPLIADVAARQQAGLILMHSRGSAQTLHTQLPSADVFAEVISSLRGSIAEAEQRGIRRAGLALDPGIGFGKTAEQNLELIADLHRFAEEFTGFPILIGTSRKSFIGRVLNDAPVEQRLFGTMASVAAAVLNGGAHIVRVHDVRAAVETVRVADAIKHAADAIKHAAPAAKDKVG